MGGERHCENLVSASPKNTTECPRPGARFSKAPEIFRARKAIFKSSDSKNGEVYTLGTMRLKQLCTRKVRDFAMALRARKVSGAFQKRPPGLEPRPLDQETSILTSIARPPSLHRCIKGCMKE